MSDDWVKRLFLDEDDEPKWIGVDWGSDHSVSVEWDFDPKTGKVCYIEYGGRQQGRSARQAWERLRERLKSGKPIDFS